MADEDKIGNTSSSDPEKNVGLSQNTSVQDGEVGVSKYIHADPNDGDIAYKAFAGHEAEVITMTPEEEKALLRKIDWNLMPVCLLLLQMWTLADVQWQMLCVVYGLNYLDKTTLSYASVMGLQTAYNLEGTNYQWLGSMFYIGYLAWEYPTSRLLQRYIIPRAPKMCI